MSDRFHALSELARLPFSPADAERTWMESALCSETDPDAFHPEKGGSTAPAKRVCAACPVRAECLEYALRHKEREGVWGGLAPRERAKLLRESEPAVTLLSAVA